MNFLYFAYGVGILVVTVLTLFILTMIGSTFLPKALLESIIHPLFFIGLGIVGFLKTRKAPVNKYINSALLSLLLATLMGMFVFITGVVPNGFNLFLLASFISFQIGSGLYFVKHKYLKTNT